LKRDDKNTTNSDLRSKAEERLAKAGSYPMDGSTSKLVHELRVHQIELEMQNEELLHARAEIEVGLEKYSLLYDFAPVGYFTLSDDGTIQEANLTAASLLGVDRSLLINRHFSNFLSREEYPVLIEFLKKVFENTTGKSCEVMLSGDKDNPKYVHIAGTAVKGKGGAWQCLMAVLDITEWKRFETEKKKLEIQFAQTQKIETIGTFAGGIAHDFNNILSAIIGYAELAMVDSTKPEEVRSHLAGVIKAGKRARDLVSQILSFSRHGEMRYEPVMIQSVIRESLKMLRPIIPSSIEIHQKLNSSGKILADPVQIHQVMMNLTNVNYFFRSTTIIIPVS